MEDKADNPGDDEGEKTVGIPENMRVRRRYTMSEAALEQRRKAALQPQPNNAGNRNGWRHGRYASNFLARIKPCLSTCPNYPCSLVEDGRTAPGKDCLDAEEMLNIVRAVHSALKDPESQEGLQEISASVIGNNIRILEMLQEDIFRDGTILKSVKTTDKGSHTEYKLHPAFNALPKMIQDMGFSLDSFALTPKVKKQLGTDEEAARSITDMFKAVGGQLAAARKKGGEAPR